MAKVLVKQAQPSSDLKIFIVDRKFFCQKFDLPFEIIVVSVKNVMKI